MSDSRRLFIGLLISAGFVGLAVWSLQVRGVSLSEVMDRLSAGDYRMVGLYFGLLVFLQVVRCCRWGILVRGFGDVPWSRVLPVAAVGLMSIALLPMRLGEAVRPILISDRRHIRLSEAAATVVVERVIDGLCISALFIATLVALRDWSLPDEFMFGAKAVATVFGGAATVLVLSTLAKERARRWVSALLRPLSPRFAARVTSAFDAFFEAMRTLLSMRRRAAVYLITTLLMWGLTALSLMPIFWAFDIDLPVIASCAVLCVMVVGFMIPAGPASTGTFNYAIILALMAFGVNEGTTGALAILLYVVLIAVNLLVGLVGIWAGGMSLRGVLGASGRTVVESAE